MSRIVEINIVRNWRGLTRCVFFCFPFFPSRLPTFTAPLGLSVSNFKYTSISLLINPFQFRRRNYEQQNGFSSSLPGGINPSGTERTSFGLNPESQPVNDALIPQHIYSPSGFDILSILVSLMNHASQFTFFIGWNYVLIGRTLLFRVTSLPPRYISLS